MTDQEILNEGRVHGAVGRIRAFCPRFNIYPKSASRLHRLLGAVLGVLGNRDYLRSFWTTLGFRAAFGSNPADPRPPYKAWDWRDVWHEGYHAYTARRITRPLSWVVWSFPACLVFPLAAAAGYQTHGWYHGAGGFSPLWWLVGLVCLLPLPAPGRTLLELRGYAIQLAIAQSLGEWNMLSVNEVLETPFCVKVVDWLAGPAYYWACPRPLARWLVARVVRRIGVTGDLSLFERSAWTHAKRVADGR